MKHKQKTVLFIMFTALLIAGCATTQESETMTALEAQKVISDFKQAHGTLLDADPTPPTSMVEVFEIVKSDDIMRFEAARQFAAGKKGIDALSVRAALQLFWASAQLGVSNYLTELAFHHSEEAALIKKRQQDGYETSEGEKARVKELNAKVKELEQVSEALRLLSKTHLKAGEDLTNEIIRQFPDKPDGYRSKANFHRLRTEWVLFTEAITKAERLGGKDQPGILFLRAMERIQRFDLKNEGIALLMELRHMAPEYIRVQAALVMAQTDIEHTYEELQKLKATSPRHLVVHIAGPIIEEEFQTSAALRQARQ